VVGDGPMSAAGKPTNSGTDQIAIVSQSQNTKSKIAKMKKLEIRNVKRKNGKIKKPLVRLITSIGSRIQEGFFLAPFAIGRLSFPLIMTL
jgi:acetyl-CoA carboxylase carboxyltransferase component